MNTLDEIVSEELDRKLAGLSPKQVAAIERIVSMGYVTEEPVAPRAIFTGPDAVCTFDTFYRRGKWDVEQQKWKAKPGWKWQPDFTEALSLAKRLVLQARTVEEIDRVRKIRSLALDNAADVLEYLVAIATDSDKLDGDRKPNKDRVQAAAYVLKYAGLDQDYLVPSQADTAEEEWWRVMEEGIADL